MKIKFLGAAGTVTGSSYLVTPETGGPILIDLGMFQGSEEIEKMNYIKPQMEAGQLAGVVLTHAHLDHCGRLPMLGVWGYTGEIWMTPATAEITELSLLDSAKIGKEDKQKPALYDRGQVEETVKRFKTIDYHKPFRVGSLEFEFKDAGHILGSASVVVRENETTVVFSGDLGNSPEDLIKVTETINSADGVVMESTYGDSLHPVEDVPAMLAAEINAIEESRGTLLIPAFSIERSQEILHRIAHLKKEGKIKAETQVFMDSPMAEKTTLVFEKYRNLWNTELEEDARTGDPFNFPGLTITEKPDDTRVGAATGGRVIIAGSGMMSGGRIVGHAINYLPAATTRLLIVGYQAEGTLGRQILQGEKRVKIKGVEVEIKATITEIKAMSSHADQAGLLRWLKGIKGVNKVYLTHGENTQRAALAEKIKTEAGISEIVIPVLNQEETCG